MKSNGISAALMAALCIASASTLTACGGVDTSEEGVDTSDLPAEELVGEGSDEIFSCSYQTLTPNSTKTTLHWGAVSVGDNYGDSVCRRFIVEFNNYEKLSVSWDTGFVSEQACENMRLHYTAYTQSGGSWFNKGSFSGHGVWHGPLVGCSVEADTGHSHPSLGTGTKYRIAVDALDVTCGHTSCYNDYKRVRVDSVPVPL